MSVEAEMRIVRRLGFFACLPEPQLRTLIFGAERLRLQEGRVLYNEGDIADSAYIILGGRVDLFRTAVREFGNDRQLREFRQIVYFVKAGAMLGAFALISEKTRETGAYIAQRGDVLRINRSVFRRLLYQHADMRNNLSRYIFTNFQNMIAKMERRAKNLAAA